MFVDDKLVSLPRAYVLQLKEFLNCSWCPTLLVQVLLLPRPFSSAPGQGKKKSWIIFMHPIFFPFCLPSALSSSPKVGSHSSSSSFSTLQFLDSTFHYAWAKPAFSLGFFSIAAHIFIPPVIMVIVQNLPSLTSLLVIWISMHLLLFISFGTVHPSLPVISCHSATSISLESVWHLLVWECLSHRTLQHLRRSNDLLEALSCFLSLYLILYLNRYKWHIQTFSVRNYQSQHNPPFNNEIITCSPLIFR